MSNAFKIFSIFFATLVQASTAVGAPTFSISSLGVGDLPSDIRNFSATGINNLGQVVGWYGSAGATKTFLYTPGLGTVSLGSFGQGRSYATGINDKGEIVGTYGPAYDFSQPTKAFIYSPTDGIRELVSPTGGGMAPTTINNAGQVAGSSHVSGNSGDSRSFLYTPENGMSIGRFDQYISDINNDGFITGSLQLATGAQHAYYSDSLASSIDIGTLGGGQSRGTSINSKGQITGQSWTAVANSAHAFLYSKETGMIDLGGDWSEGRAINDSGHIIGMVGSGVSRPFLYTPEEGMINLGALVNYASNWSIDEVTGINNRGEIIGIGRRNGLREVFILSPTAVPELSSIQLLAIGLLVIGWVGFRKKVRPH